MNIFALSMDAEQAAKWHMDKHVVKMPLETAQMLCSALHRHGHTALYKPGYVKHPCTVWCGNSRSNFEWLCGLGVELCKEFTYRYGKVHGSEKVIMDCISNAGNIPDGELTTFAMAMPVEFKKACPIEAYREYYRKAKAHLAFWRMRDEPVWYREDLCLNVKDATDTASQKV
jgi:hypothetical protein